MGITVYRILLVIYLMYVKGAIYKSLTVKYCFEIVIILSYEYELEPLL